MRRAKGAIEIRERHPFGPWCIERRGLPNSRLHAPDTEATETRENTETAVVAVRRVADSKGPDSAMFERRLGRAENLRVLLALCVLRVIPLRRLLSDRGIVACRTVVTPAPSSRISAIRPATAPLPRWHPRGVLQTPRLCGVRT